MMQVANDVEFRGHKLVTSSLTVEQAEFIIRKLNGDPAIIFIDNIADDFDTIEKIYSAPNLKFVAFERFYLFELIEHKIEKKQTTIIDVTDLTEKDIQAIYAKIPEELRSGQLRTPETYGDTPPCIFEFISSNIRFSDFKKRFENSLSQLRIQFKDLYDLFLMCCYVHSCRCPVSFEMVMAFLRDEISSFTDVYDKVETLGAFLADFTDNIVDAEQDYFMPRSMYLSESVLDIAPSKDLKNVILKFYKEISPMRIARFDVFRRKAFDAALMKNVFDQWEEGVSFYMMARDRDESPFLKQQAALYLARKKRFKEAFNWIDEALVQSGYKVPSIRNSHAIILFRANISSPFNETAKSSLQQSMDILTECYKSDRRKTYHALVFADHSMQYWDVFADSAAKEHLSNGYKMRSAIRHGIEMQKEFIADYKDT